jgi:leucyl aminopeptidase (aminopeptidase T)
MTGPVYSELRAREMARLALTKTLRVKPGESVTIETWDSTVNWASAFVLEARRLGALPVLLYNDEATYWKTLELAGAKILGVSGKQEWALLERTDAYVSFWGPSDTLRESRLPEDTQEALMAYEERWFETANRTGLRLARMFLGRVSSASARAYGIDEDAWRRELVEASLVDPIRLQRVGLKIAERFRKGQVVEIRHPNGTDLRLRLRHREPRVDSGILPPRPNGRGQRGRGHPGIQDVALPAGVVMVAVDEESGDGRFVSNSPSDSLDGPLTGGEWVLRNGHLESYNYRSGGGQFDRTYREAGPHLGTPALLSVGLNPKIRDAPLMRDQRLGTITFGLGGNRYWGGQTDGHGFHPYLHLLDGELRVDGKVVVQPTE